MPFSTHTAYQCYLYGIGFTVKTLHFTAMATMEHVTRAGLSILRTYASHCGIGVGVAHRLYNPVVQPRCTTGCKV